MAIFLDWRSLWILRIEPVGCGEGIVGGMIVVGCGTRARVRICLGRVLGGMRVCVDEGRGIGKGVVGDTINCHGRRR
jgi:hypothetical protein